MHARVELYIYALNRICQFFIDEKNKDSKVRGIVNGKEFSKNT